MDRSKHYRISIVIPAYNSESFIGNALHSVFRQTIEPYEVIVCDDGSTDNTCDVVMKFFAKYPKVRTELIKQPHRGPGAARNKGIKYATGEWIAFLDADDTWKSCKLEIVASYIDKYPEINFFCHSEIEFLLDGTKRQLLHFRYHKFEIPLINQLYRRNFFSTSAVVAKRSLFLQDDSLFDEQLMTGQDFELWLRLCHKLRPKMIPEVLGYYIQRRGNISSFAWKRFKSSIIIANKYKREVGYLSWLHKNFFIAGSALKNKIIKPIFIKWFKSKCV